MSSVKHSLNEETIEDSPKRMRKGTRSCTACRRRKVRCIFPSGQAKVCIHCSRRGAICVPQGLKAESSTTAGTNEDQISSKDSVSLSDALKCLRMKVDRVLQAPSRQDSLPENQRSRFHRDTKTVNNSESVQTDCAPIIRLFDNGLITHLPEQGDIGSDEYSIREHSSSPDSNDSLPPGHVQAVRGLCAALPPESELKEILDHRSDWWDAWRETYGLIWGDEADSTLQDFAIRALSCGHPALLGSLLVCLAFSVGTFEKYLQPVELWVLHDDELASGEHGLQCLMGLGLCFFSALQPRKAWTVYRRANSLLQLNGIHRTHRKSEKLDSIFWQLFHADRWMSLMIGLPYSTPDDLCDLYIPPVDSIPLVTFHYRHLAVLTGRVIDCLQALNGPSLSTIAKINEQIDVIASHLPPDYLDITHVSTHQDPKEKYARVFRLTHVHHLKASLHLPLFLQRCDEAKREYGRRICVDSSRIFLEAFLAIYDDNPTRAVMDNNIKLTGFSAFASAITLFLYLLDCGQGTASRRPSSQKDTLYDENLISRTMAALRDCSGGQPSSLCGQCHAALEGLVTICREVGNGRVRKIALPYFGVVSIWPKKNETCHRAVGNGANHSASHDIDENTSLYPPEGNDSGLFDMSTPLDDLLWNYHGHLMINDPLQTSLLVEAQYNADFEVDWNELQMPFDWTSFP